MRVAVVGCGTGGPAAALLLKSDGHDVEVFERAPRIDPVGAGLLLQPTGMAVLDRLGLLDEIDARSDRVATVRGRTEHGRAVMDLRYADLAPGAYGLGVHRGTLSTAFTAALQAAEIPLHCGVTVTGRAGGVLTGAEEHGRFDLIVAADGSRGTLRSELPARVRTYTWGALWTILHDAGSQRTGVLDQTFRTTHRLLGLLPTGGERVSVFWSVRADRIDAVRARGVDAFKAQVRELHPGVEDLLDQIDDMDALLPAVYLDVRMPQWHADGLAIVGDAGHAMSPQLGQGVNLALMDAATLADTLRAGGDLAAYSRARRASIRYYTFMSWALNAVFQHDRPRMALPRDLLIGPSQRVPWMRKLMLETLAGKRSGFFR